MLYYYDTGHIAACCSWR